MDPGNLGPLQKKLREGATLLFPDEASSALTPAVGRTWAPRGQTPQLQESWRPFERVMALGALAVQERRGHLHSELFFHLERSRPEKRSWHGPDMVRFLAQVARHRKGEVYVIWDGAQQHRSAVVKHWVEAHPRFHLVPLPAYSPDFDPEENVWGWVKGHELTNLSAHSGEELQGAWLGALRQAQQRPALLEGFLRASALPWGTLLNQGRPR